MRTRKPLSSLQTITEVFQARLHESPDFPVYTFGINADETEVLTYAQLDSSTRAIRYAIKERNIGVGPIILLYPTNSVHFIRALLACFMAGSIGVPLMLGNKNTDLVRLTAIIRDSKAKAVFTLQNRTEELSRLLGPDILAGLEIVATDSIHHPGDVPDVRKGDHADSIAHLQYTSGSTKTPKGVAITNSNLLHNLQYIDKGFKHDGDSVSVSWLPHFHDMGLVYGFLAPALIGFRSVILHPGDFVREPSLWLRTITRHQATHSGGPNFAYDLCCNRVARDQLEEINLRSWRVAFLGAEMIRAGTLERFANTFRSRGFERSSYYPAYGLAEATLKVTGYCSSGSTPISVFSRDRLSYGIALSPAKDEVAVSLVSCGETSNEMEVVIVDPERMKQLAPNSVGEIWVAGPSVAAGYWNNPLETDASFRASLGDGTKHYLRTGDLGFLRTGELFVIGRLKDLIIVRGAKFYPEDLEEVMSNSHSAVSGRIGAAFTILEDDGERLILVQECDRHYPPRDIQEARERIRTEIANKFGLVADELLLVRRGTIPRTSSGKVQRGSCRELYQSGRFLQLEAVREARPVRQTEAPGTTNDLNPPYLSIEVLENMLVAEAQKLRPDICEPIRPHDPLLGRLFDSLELARYQVSTSRLFGIESQLHQLMKATTIRELAELLHDRLSRETLSHQPSREPSATAKSNTSIALDAEARLLALDAIYPNSPAHRIVFGITLSGPLDVERLRRATQRLVGANPSLRKRFWFSDAETQTEVIRFTEVVMSTINAREALAPDARSVLINRTAAQLARTPMELSRGPLLATSLISFSADDHCMIVCIHHIISDAASVDLLMEQIVQYYSSDSAMSLSDLEASEPGEMYRSSARWDDEDLAFWTAYLADTPNNIDFPGRTGAEPRVGAEASLHPISLPSCLTKLLRSERWADATPFMVLFAVFWQALAAWSDRTQLVVATPISGRVTEEDWKRIGLFAQPLLLNLKTPQNRTFAEFLASTRSSISNVLAHQHVPFGTIIRAVRPNNRLQRLPFLQVMFNYIRHLRRTTLNSAGIEWSLVPLETGATESLINVVFRETRDGQLTALLTCPRDYFTPDSITRLVSLFEERLLEVTTADLTTMASQ